MAFIPHRGFQYLFVRFDSIANSTSCYTNTPIHTHTRWCVGYGIATPMGSPWRDKISLAILELQEKGEIQMLYDKWWKLPKDSCSTDRVKQSTKANALGVNNIGGVFVVLLCGLAFAVLIAILEFCHSKRPQKHLSYIDNIGMEAILFLVYFPHPTSSFFHVHFVLWHDNRMPPIHRTFRSKNYWK